MKANDRQISFQLDIDDGPGELNTDLSMLRIFRPKPRIIRTVVTLLNSKLGRKELCLTFMVSEAESVDNVLDQLENQGIIIDRDGANIAVYFKKSCLTTTHRSSLKSRSRGSFLFDNTNDTTNDTDTTSNSFDSNDRSDAIDDTMSSHLVITKRDCSQSLSKLHELQHAIRSDLKYEIELCVEESAWKTTLETSLRNKDISEFGRAVRDLDLSFDELQDIFMINSVGFRYYIQQRQRQKVQILSFSEVFVSTDLVEHSRCIIGECIEDIITNDNHQFLEVIFMETDLVNILHRGDRDIAFQSAVNVLSFCFILALQSRSKNIIHFLGQFWLKHVCHSYDEHDILNSFVASIKQREDKRIRRFMGYIGSVIEPSMMSSFRELSMSPRLSPKWIEGRVARYQKTKEVLCQCLDGNIDVVRIILDNDGYRRGLCEYVHQFTVKK